MNKKTQSSTPTDVKSPWDDTETTPEEILEVANTIAGAHAPKSTSNADKINFGRGPTKGNQL